MWKSPSPLFHFSIEAIRMCPDVRVSDSHIEGKGVFAMRRFKKGEVVLRWDTSHRLTKTETDRLDEGTKRYVTFSKGSYIHMQPPERYVNHSCDANTYVRDFCDVARRDIRKGEEITADYSEEGVPDLNMDCRCGSEKCRRVIRSREKN